MDQLALFPDVEVTGTGQLHPWPAAEPEPEDTATADTGQLAFGEENSQ